MYLILQLFFIAILSYFIYFCVANIQKNSKNSPTGQSPKNTLLTAILCFLIVFLIIIVSISFKDAFDYMKLR